MTNALDLVAHILLKARQKIMVSCELLKDIRFYNFLFIVLHKHFSHL